MKPRSFHAAFVCLGLGLLARPSSGWEAVTTHAGLTEQAALASTLHTRLIRDHGHLRGLFQPLTIPPADAPELFQVVSQLNPIHGYVPDARGRLTAIGWLVAGSVMADSTEGLAAQHFFNVEDGRGLDPDDLGNLAARLRHRLLAALSRHRLPPKGAAAPDWIMNPANPMGLAGFQSQYAKSISARTPAERERHLAGALLAAGAMLHVLQDMGSPSHVRGDVRAHFDRLGPDPSDTGSRFEHIAALAFGRLGVPAPGSIESDRPLRAFFTAEDETGLADRTARSWFSAYTLPGNLDLGRDPLHAIRERLPGTLARKSPAPPPHLDIMRAREGHARIETASGVCLANYHVDSRRLSWSIQDTCAVEQLASILPTVAGYSGGLLETLFRGSMSFDVAPAQTAIRAGSVALGAGTLTVFADDSLGIRSKVFEAKVSSARAGAAFATLPGVPDGTHRLAALFEGQDASGRPLIATGVADLTAAP